MENILKLYEIIKNTKGVDIALIDSYIKVILKDSECETIEELINLIKEKENEAATLHESTSELNQNLYNIMEEKRKLLDQQIDLKNEASSKSLIKVLLPILGVMGIGVVCVVIFFNIPVLLLALASLFAAVKIGLNAKEIIWSDYNINVAKLDELSTQEIDLNSQFNQKLYEAIGLNNSIDGLGKTVKDIVTFLETYVTVSKKNESESLTQDTTLEEVEAKEEPTFEEENGKSLN